MSCGEVIALAFLAFLGLVVALPHLFGLERRP